MNGVKLALFWELPPSYGVKIQGSSIFFGVLRLS